MEPLELQLSAILRRRLFSLSDRPELLLAEYARTRAVVVVAVVVVVVGVVVVAEMVYVDA